MNKMVSIFLITLLTLKAVSCFPYSGGITVTHPTDIEEQNPYDMPESCIGKSFCTEKGDDYPDDDVEVLLKTVLRNETTAVPVDDFVYNSLSGQNSECKTNSIRVPIYYIVDEFNKTRAVVQSTNKGLCFEQKFDLRWCDTEGRTNKTAHFLNSALSKFIMFCENSYMTFDFLVVSSGPKLNTETARAKIPVCCKCRYKK